MFEEKNRVAELFEVNNGEYLNECMLTNAVNQNMLVNAILYLQNLTGDEVNYCANHDIIYLDFFKSDNYSKIKEEDVIYLLRSGVYWDSECEYCMAMFC